jgi:hypothetical protein
MHLYYTYHGFLGQSMHLLRCMLCLVGVNLLDDIRYCNARSKKAAVKAAEN